MELLVPALLAKFWLSFPSLNSCTATCGTICSGSRASKSAWDKLPPSSSSLFVAASIVAGSAPLSRAQASSAPHGDCGDVSVPSCASSKFSSTNSGGSDKRGERVRSPDFPFPAGKVASTGL